MKKQITAAILGCGSRGALFCELMTKMDGAYRITALCDISEVHNVKFSMYALCALIVATILAILLVVNFAGSASNKKKSKGGQYK